MKSVLLNGSMLLVEQIGDLEGDQQIGYDIIISALERPFYKILEKYNKNTAYSLIKNCFFPSLSINERDRSLHGRTACKNDRFT